MVGGEMSGFYEKAVKLPGLISPGGNKASRATAESLFTLSEDQMPDSSNLSRDQKNGARYAAALRAIIARADNNEPGTSKVQDMKRIAVEALGNEVAK